MTSVLARATIIMNIGICDSEIMKITGSVRLCILGNSIMELALKSMPSAASF